MLLFYWLENQRTLALVVEIRRNKMPLQGGTYIKCLIMSEKSPNGTKKMEGFELLVNNPDLEASILAYLKGTTPHILRKYTAFQHLIQEKKH